LPRHLAMVGVCSNHLEENAARVLDSREINWPEGFVKRMRQQLGSEADAFFLALLEPTTTSIRLHHKKGRSSFELNERVKWCDSGYYLDERPSFHLDPHWHAGAYYVQEASSMILDAVIKHMPIEVKPKIWLDLCAAPGGKSGILAKHLGPGDVLIANEVVSQRKSVLYENLIKGGYLNTFISGERSSNFPEAFADIILIDAPCAGEGMMRKEPEAINQWSERLVYSCSLLQKEIVRDAVKSLKPGGWLIYSTCSYSPDENIDNVDSFLRYHPLENMIFQFPEDWHVTEIKKGAATGYQLFPHKVRGEGLFFAVFQKKGNLKSQAANSKKQRKIFEPLDSSTDQYLHQPDGYLAVATSNGFDIISREAESVTGEVRMKLPKAELIGRIGEQKGKDFIPSHFLAMSGIQSNDLASISMNASQALDFLERKTPLFEANHPPGWYMAVYQGSHLGWMKNTQQGWKNYYPMNWRLRNRK
jgi:16S rRNA C967 or C1407 C5-methylase (RsmB/RsmF family)/NOL1/NOP2/fmu family ribosome biogenesis protein